jgi:hypothetical protein
MEAAKLRWVKDKTAQMAADSFLLVEFLHLAHFTE